MWIANQNEEGADPNAEGEEVQEIRKTYLGDGVYANWDGFHVVLTTEDGIRISNKIYFDSYALTALANFLVDNFFVDAKELFERQHGSED